MTVRPLFAWYDMWVGAYWDRTQRKLYVFPVPCLGVVVSFRSPKVTPDGDCIVEFCRSGCPIMPMEGETMRADGRVRCETCGCQLRWHKSYAYPSGLGHTFRGCDGVFYHL